MSKAHILDACAIISYVKREIGWEKISAIMEQAFLGEIEVFMHEINLLEVYYGFCRENGESYAKKIIAEVEYFCSIISGLTPDVFYEAGRLKSTFKISLADSIILAESIVLDAVLVTSDHHEFDVIERNEPISFLWLR